eukprot:CAMPEP_0202351796 /NCGR_PEP_ID=MMETSP1126-20121109/8274_1 /ASSEMBLY_ACC=CAM_ASM_000457 /TAXON_ID=3047 /ORGANISM="Dunaliella tertiolecta, Strain CCMP1320" /LENGTH=46 /DNA_ID=CAMNT_0048943937 /DNA_START=430 /DNA_END=566 /DNA_ORIENTATION=+
MRIGSSGQGGEGLKAVHLHEGVPWHGLQPHAQQTEGVTLRQQLQQR